MDQASFHNTLTYFSRCRSPDAAADALRWLVTAPHSMQVEFHENPCNVLLYAFVRLGQLHPELLRVYEGQFDDATPWGQRFLARVLAHCGDESSEVWARGVVDRMAFSDLRDLAAGKRRDPIRTHPVQTGTHLDQLWMEFFLTGERDSIAEIANCLLEPSELKIRLNRWLRQPGFLAWLNRKRRKRVIARLEAELGIVCDQEEVKNLDDVDCLCLQEEVLGDIQYHDFSRAAECLPFYIPAAARNRIGIKMVAKMSLFSNALQHPIVREFCLDAAEPPDRLPSSQTQYRLSFLDIATNIHAAEKNAAAVLRLAEEFVRVDPHSRRLKLAVSRLRADNELRDLMQADTPRGNDASHDQLNMLDLLEDCVEQTEQATSYYGARNVTLVSTSKPRTCSWRFAYEAPARLEVYQQVGDDMHDAWLTMPGRTVHILHTLIQAGSTAQMPEPTVNQRLLVDDILKHLTSMQVERCGISDAGCGFMVLIGRLSETPPLAIEFGASPNDTCSLTVWIDKDFRRRLRLSKYSLQAGPVTIDHAFSGYNEARVSSEAFFGGCVWQQQLQT